MKRNILIAAVFAYALAAQAAGNQAAKNVPPRAAGGGTVSAGLLERLDRNNDGFVTRDEARDASELQGRFAELDKDNDGKISAAEMRALDAERGSAGNTRAKR